MSKEDVHVFPLDDILPHNTDDSECMCDPEILVEGGALIIVHNSYDGRETNDREQTDSNV